MSMTCSWKATFGSTCSCKPMVVCQRSLAVTISTVALQAIQARLHYAIFNSTVVLNKGKYTMFMIEYKDIGWWYWLVTAIIITHSTDM